MVNQWQRCPVIQRGLLLRVDSTHIRANRGGVLVGQRNIAFAHILPSAAASSIGRSGGYRSWPASQEASLDHPRLVFQMYHRTMGRGGGEAPFYRSLFPGKMRLWLFGETSNQVSGTKTPFPGQRSSTTASGRLPGGGGGRRRGAFKCARTPSPTSVLFLKSSSRRGY